MVIPEERQWQEKLGDLMVIYHRTDLKEKKVKEEKAKLKSEILKIMKERTVYEIILRGLKAVYTEKKKLPSDLLLLKPILKAYWNRAIKKIIKHKLDRKYVEENLIPKGEIDKEAYEEVLIPEDQLKVTKVKTRVVKS